ncbi:hypothetical protein PCE1_002880 [Barthelona sp. PCE]
MRIFLALIVFLAICTVSNAAQLVKFEKFELNSTSLHIFNVSSLTHDCEYITLIVNPEHNVLDKMKIYAGGNLTTTVDLKERGYNYLSFHLVSQQPSYSYELIPVINSSKTEVEMSAFCSVNASIPKAGKVHFDFKSTNVSQTLYERISLNDGLLTQAHQIVTYISNNHRDVHRSPLYFDKYLQVVGKTQTTLSDFESTFSTNFTTSGYRYVIAVYKDDADRYAYPLGWSSIYYSNGEPGLNVPPEVLVVIGVVVIVGIFFAACKKKGDEEDADITEYNAI